MSLSNTLVELINIPSVIGNEEEITTAIEFRMAATRPVLRLGNALVVGEPTGKPLVVLYGHIDTVPEQGNGTASVDAERVHGLGACDMKAGVAVMIHLLEDPVVLDGPYDVVGVLYDKEEGPSAENGLEDVLNVVDWLADAEFSVVLEPTDLNLELGCNGAMNADIIFVGHAAHSARPWLGENAVTKAGAWLAMMHERMPEPVEIAGLEYLEVFSVTRGNGGIANNVLPSRFTMNLNYRFPPSTTSRRPKRGSVEWHRKPTRWSSPTAHPPERSQKAIVTLAAWRSLLGEHERRNRGGPMSPDSPGAAYRP